MSSYKTLHPLSNLPKDVSYDILIIKYCRLLELCDTLKDILKDTLNKTVNKNVNIIDKVFIYNF
jgi:hypothetical protein